VFPRLVTQRRSASGWSCPPPCTDKAAPAALRWVRVRVRVRVGVRVGVRVRVRVRVRG
jgi:hypothetical protein